jgi:hypothetical protein
MTPPTDIDLFEQFAGKLSRVDEEIPAPPALGRGRAAARHRADLRSIEAGVGGVATIAVLVAALAVGVSLRGAAQTPASSAGGGMPSAAVSSLPSAVPSPADASAALDPTKGPGTGTSAPTGQLNPFHAAVQSLVEDGTINQAQAEALHRQIDAGQLDPEELVKSGTLTPAQAQAAEDRLSAVKQSLAPRSDSTEPPATSTTKKDSAGDAGSAAEAAAHAAFYAAVKELVEDGTINQHAADVLRRGIDAGSIDENALVASGTLTAAQMEIVQARLSAVKQSFASGPGGPGSAAPPASKEPSKTT